MIAKQVAVRIVDQEDAMCDIFVIAPNDMISAEAGKIVSDAIDRVRSGSPDSYLWEDLEVILKEKGFVVPDVVKSTSTW